MSRRILSVSYDVSLLATRQWLLQQRGYSVTSALGYTKAVEQCHQSHFDLFVLGHSIPGADKLSLIKTFRENCSAPILSLERHGDDFVQCDFHASPDDPAKFITVIDDILARKEERSRQQRA